MVCTSIVFRAAQFDDSTRMFSVLKSNNCSLKLKTGFNRPYSMIFNFTIFLIHNYYSHTYIVLHMYTYVCTFLIVMNLFTKKVFKFWNFNRGSWLHALKDFLINQPHLPTVGEKILFFLYLFFCVDGFDVIIFLLLLVFCVLY